jgi:hypothetical protein
MPNLDIQTVELVTSLRVAPANGAPSSAEYNEVMREMLADFSSITSIINDQLLPIVNALPSTAITGLEGKTLYSDSSDSTSLFYDANQARSLTVSESLKLMQAIVNSVNQKITDLSIQVGALQSRLSSTKQNDIALAIQGLSDSINAIRGITTSQGGMITELQALGQLDWQKVSTGSVTPTSTESIEIDWAVPFPNNSYVVTYALQDDSGFLEITGFSYLTAGAGVLIRVRNTDSSLTHTGTVHAHARLQPHSS